MIKCWRTKHFSLGVIFPSVYIAVMRYDRGMIFAILQRLEQASLPKSGRRFSDKNDAKTKNSMRAFISETMNARRILELGRTSNVITSPPGPAFWPAHHGTSGIPDVLKWQAPAKQSRTALPVNGLLRRSRSSQ
jgi:hypothetical protein